MLFKRLFCLSLSLTFQARVLQGLETDSKLKMTTHLFSSLCLPLSEGAVLTRGDKINPPFRQARFGVPERLDKAFTL